MKINGEMSLNIESSCKVSPQNEFLNALAMQMTGQKTLGANEWFLSSMSS
jgi:hypothetical protein